MTDPTQIIVEQKLSINITKWQQYNDISIQQGSNTIYVSQERLAELIKGLITFSKDRPAPDQDGAEEVLNDYWMGKDYGMLLTESDALQAMTIHARNEVDKAVKAKDAEINKLNDSITELLRQLSVRPKLKLPSEKEMYKAAENFYEDNDDKPYGRVTAFLEGAKWMQKRLNHGTNFVEQK